MGLERLNTGGQVARALMDGGQSGPSSAHPFLLREDNGAHGLSVRSLGFGVNTGSVLVPTLTSFCDPQFYYLQTRGKLLYLPPQNSCGDRMR